LSREELESCIQQLGNMAETLDRAEPQWLSQLRVRR
jgi:hypothetical protein